MKRHESWLSQKTTGYPADRQIGRFGIADGIAQKPYGIRDGIARDRKTRRDGITTPPCKGGGIPSPRRWGVHRVDSDPKQETAA
jgi:hypothetical protein